jgi:hypothetical protein
MFMVFAQSVKLKLITDTTRPMLFGGRGFAMVNEPVNGQIERLAIPSKL